MTKGVKKGKKRKNLITIVTNSLLGAAGETLYGKPPVNDHSDHDEQPLQGIITSTPLPEAPILIPNVNGASIQSKLDHNDFTSLIPLKLFRKNLTNYCF